MYEGSHCREGESGEASPQSKKQQGPKKKHAPTSTRRRSLSSDSQASAHLPRRMNPFEPPRGAAVTTSSQRSETFHLRWLTFGNVCWTAGLDKVRKGMMSGVKNHPDRDKLLSTTHTSTHIHPCAYAHVSTGLWRVDERSQRSAPHVYGQLSFRLAVRATGGFGRTRAE